MKVSLLRKWRGAQAFGLGAFLIAALFARTASAQAGISITINGSPVNIAPGPIMQAGRVFVPLRGVFEQLGATVVYSNGTINATGNGRSISLQIGSTQAIVDGQTSAIDVAPFIVGQSTYVPLRFISESLGAGVDWDDATSTVSITLSGAPQGGVSVSDTVDLEPPPIPVYEQPDVPQPNDIWQPGYWAWGSYGYYWVPGTWVAAPQPGYLWTPGYWSWRSANYVWVPGYWATRVGFYGGVNYGGGYFGHGYDGGRWSGRTFTYNTYVSRVNTTIVRNVYVDRNVYVNNSVTRVSYNGGPGGLGVRPTAAEQQVARLPHRGVTAAQEQHDTAAAQDRRLLATVNHNRPPVLSVARPLSTTTRPEGFVPVKPSDRVAVPVQHAPPPARVAPQRPAAPNPAPAEKAKPGEVHSPAVRPQPEQREPNATPPAARPVERATPENRPVERATPQPRPAVHATPERQPAAHATPAYHPAVRATPEYHPPVRATPQYHAPAPATAAPRAPVQTAPRAPAQAAPRTPVQPAPRVPAPAAPATHAAPPPAPVKKPPATEETPHPAESPK